MEAYAFHERLLHRRDTTTNPSHARKKRRKKAAEQAGSAWHARDSYSVLMKPIQPTIIAQTA